MHRLPQARPARTKVVLVVVVALVAAAASVAVIALRVRGQPSSGQVLTGTFSLSLGKPSANPCTSPPGFQDLVRGAPVTVRSESGATLGSSVLSAGAADTADGSCSYRFVVPNVTQADTYFISVAGRGAIPYSAAALAAKRWNVDLHLGVP